MSGHEILVLGAGIAGTLAALQLSDAGFDVALIDRAGEVMAGTSRWNEGKIHLGYCYLGDASMQSAHLMLEGASCFVDEIERLTGTAFREAWFSEPVVYLVDPDTLFPAELLWARSRQLAAVLEERRASNPGLLRWVGGRPTLQRLTPAAAERATGLDRIADAWRTTERAVAPGPVALAIRGALKARGISLIAATVTGVSAQPMGWVVECGSERISARAVINATWESRALIDRYVTGHLAPCSIRFRCAAFGQGLVDMKDLAPSTRILGRFGDVTPYGNGEAYFSWYPAGLTALSDDGCPPEPPGIDPGRLLQQMLDGLGVDRAVLEEPTARWQVHGGHVVAYGQGDIDHAASPLHRRSRPDAIELAPGYVSVDTGKYSLGPLMAARAADLVQRHLQS